MNNNIYGNGQKKHARIYLNDNLVGQVVYYYWSESEILIRLHSKDKYVVAQFYKDSGIEVELEDKDNDIKEYQGE